MSLHMLSLSRRELSSPDSELLANPASQTFQAIAVARTISVAARVGLFAELADRPRSVDELALALGLVAEPLRAMLDVLVGRGLLEYRHGCYAVAVQARHWLDPDSETSITTVLSHSIDYSDWWNDLERIVTGQAVPIGSRIPASEAEQVRYTRAQFEVARLLSDDIVAAIDLPEDARSVLDLGGSHGWYAAALCQTNPSLRGTVVDFAGAAMIGREIMWDTGMDDVVGHEIGDPATAELGGPHDVVLCFSVLNRLDPRGRRVLLHRIRRSMATGAVLVTFGNGQLDGSIDGPQPGSAAAIELFRSVQHGCPPPSTAELTEALAATGFGPMRIQRLSATRDITIQIATAV